MTSGMRLEGTPDGAGGGEQTSGTEPGNSDLENFEAAARAIGAAAAMFEVMAGWQGFWVAHTLLAGLVLSEMAKSVWMLIAYRRGF